MSNIISTSLEALSTNWKVSEVGVLDAKPLPSRPTKLCLLKLVSLA
jgi:hypothetical protein